MKARTVAAVSAALFAARVHAEDFRKVEVFADAACATVVKIESMEKLMDCHNSTQHTNGEEFVAYYKLNCTDTQTLKNFYSDSQCTTPHPNVTWVETTSLDTCGDYHDGSNRWRKVTCPFSASQTVAPTAIMHTWFSAGCTGEIEHHGIWPIDECELASDYDWDNHTWTIKSAKFVQEGDRLARFRYTDLACGAGEEKEWDTPCNICGEWDTDGSYEIQCPWETTTGAPPQALITAALAVPLAGLLASALL